MNGFRRICAAVLGAVFFTAGTLKLMDPVGAGLVVEEYLKFFHLRFLLGGSGFIACVLALLECFTGAALLTGVFRKVSAIVSGAMTGIFTIITIILVIAKPVMDCGCFGEAVHLTHVQTLIKNLVLCALWLLAFMPFRDFGLPQRVKYVSFSIACISSCLFLLYSSLSIPLRDYTDFKPGTETGGDVYDPDAQALYFSDAAGEYADSLARSGKVMLLSSYDVAKLDEKAVKKAADFCSLAEEQGFTVLLLASSTPEELERAVMDPVLLGHSFFADRRMLMTLNRSNGGVSYLSDGQIIAKWSARSLPDKEELTRINGQAPMDYMLSALNRGRARSQGYFLYVFAVMLLL